MKFLIDRCAGRRVAQWLRSEEHDVVEARELGPDPGDRQILEWAADQKRILITLDTDFGHYIFLEGRQHAGLVRLPDVPSARRIEILEDLLTRHAEELREGAIFTVRGSKVRVSQSS